MSDDGNHDGVVERGSGFRLEEQGEATLPIDAVYTAIAFEPEPVSREQLRRETELSNEEIASATAWLHNESLVLRQTGDDEVVRFATNPRHPEFGGADRYLQACDADEIHRRIEALEARAKAPQWVGSPDCRSTEFPPVSGLLELSAC